MIAIRLGSASDVILMSIQVSWPSLVTTLNWRSASAIHTTPVSDTRMSRNEPAACRNTYLEKIRMRPPFPRRPRLPKRLTLGRASKPSVVRAPIAPWRNSGC